MLAALLLAAAWAQDPAAAVAALAAEPALAGARVGALVIDLADGSELAAHDADYGFMTASNMKLISSAVALCTLGADYRFRTELFAHGALSDGVLRGALEIRGGGDPTLGGRQEDTPAAPFERWAGLLANDLALHSIDGPVFGNDDCQPDEVMGDGWSWNYQGADYAARASGLCFAENCVQIALHLGADGFSYRLTPQTEYVQVRTAVDPSADATVSADRLPALNQIVVTLKQAPPLAPGRAAVDTNDGLSVDNPTAYAATVLRETLARAGIRAGPARDLDDAAQPLPAPERLLTQQESPPLAEILVTLNKSSQNLYAEQVLRAASRAATGDAGMAAAARHARAVLRELGVDTAGMVIADGSGLSRLNLVRPRQLAALLAAMWRGEQRALYTATLPTAGVDGTLAKRMTEGAAHRHVHAKTGFINRVAALSGYVERSDPKREPLVFSLLLNNFTCSTEDALAALDRCAEALARAAGWSAVSARDR